MRPTRYTLIKKHSLDKWIYCISSAFYITFHIPYPLLKNFL